MLSRLAWLVALTPFACSSNSLSAEQACADLAHATCTTRDTCSNNFQNAHDYGTESDCESRSAASCVLALAVKGTAATPQSREGCAEAYGSGIETCLDFFENNPVDACQAPVGTGAMGVTCAVAAQCASTYCAVANNAVCGTCQPFPAPGAACVVDGDCGRDLACAIPSGATSGTCAAWVAPGGSCLTGVNPCQPEAACVGDNPTTSAHGTCMPTVMTVGASCDGARQVAPPCDGDHGLACIPTGSGSLAGTCQMVTLANAGATCGAIGGPPTTSIADCAAGGMCVKANVGDRSGTCVAPAPDGAPCDSALGPPCLTPAKCVPTTPGVTEGTCTLPYQSACM